MSLASDIGVTPQTARRWLAALEIGFWATTLPPSCELPQAPSRASAPALPGYGTHLLPARHSRRRDVGVPSLARPHLRIVRRRRQPIPASTATRCSHSRPERATRASIGSRSSRPRPSPARSATVFATRRACPDSLPIRGLAVRSELRSIDAIDTPAAVSRYSPPARIGWLFPLSLPRSSTTGHMLASGRCPAAIELGRPGRGSNHITPLFMRSRKWRHTVLQVFLRHVAPLRTQVGVFSVCSVSDLHPVEPPGCDQPEVDRPRASLHGKMDDHLPAAAEPAHPGLHGAEGEARGDDRIHRVAALGEHPRPGLGRKVAPGRDHPAGRPHFGLSHPPSLAQLRATPYPPYSSGSPGGRVLNRRCTQRYCSGCARAHRSMTSLIRAASATSSPLGKFSSAGSMVTR